MRTKNCIKEVSIFVLLLFSIIDVNAQVNDAVRTVEKSNKDTIGWVRKGIFTFGGNEGFLHNAPSGGELASLVVYSGLHSTIIYYHNNNIWSNSFDMDYGLNYAYSTSFVPRKVNDDIDITSSYSTRIKKSKDFYLVGLVNFKSQFTKGYDYSTPDWAKNPISDFFSPAYVTAGIGAEYKKGEDLVLIVSPIAAREIFSSARYTSLSSSGAFGIDSGKTSSFEFGAYFSGSFKKNFSKNLVFTTRLDLYNDYLAKNTVASDGRVVKRDNPGNIQAYWANLLVLKSYKNISTTVGLTIGYNNNIPYSNTYLDKTTNTIVNKNQPGENLGWLQVSQIFVLGVAYKF